MTGIDYECNIACDSVNPHGDRLTTMVVTFPRIVLAEFNTHRMLSRNSASSRAIPVEKRIASVETNPFVPGIFGRNQRGMQAGAPVDDGPLAREVWLAAAARAAEGARALALAGVHKQLANRLLEPFLWHTVVVSATDWRNFLALRCHQDAQPEIQIIAEMMRDSMNVSIPEELSWREWHLPFTEEGPLESAEYCATVSSGKPRQPSPGLGERLLSAGHMSPFEHPAFASPGQFGNFRGWCQYRKTIENEANPINERTPRRRK